MTHEISNGGFSSIRLLTMLVGAALTSGLSGCAVVTETVLGVAVEEVTDSDASPRDDVQAPDGDDIASPSNLRPSSDRGQRGSVYVAGPVPGWERGPLLFGSGRRSPLFSASPYRGQCRALFNVSLERGEDPFGPLTRPPVDLFDMGNSLGISPDYVPFGRVELGGAGPQHYQWAPMTVRSRYGGGCDFLWFRLLSFGRDEGVETIHR